MLPDSHLNSVVKMKMYFNKADDCVTVLSETSHNSIIIYETKSNNFYLNRF